MWQFGPKFLLFRWSHGIMAASAGGGDRDPAIMVWGLCGMVLVASVRRTLLRDCRPREVPLGTAAGHLGMKEDCCCNNLCFRVFPDTLPGRQQDSLLSRSAKRPRGFFTIEGQEDSLLLRSAKDSLLLRSAKGILYHCGPSRYYTILYYTIQFEFLWSLFGVLLDLFLFF